MKIIYEKDAIDALHKTMLEFFKTDGDNDPEFITASEKMLLSVNKAISKALKALPSAQPETPCYLGSPCEYQNPDVKMPSAQPDRSLWFRIGEICVDESKGFITAGRAFEKIRELLREAERRTDEAD